MSDHINSIRAQLWERMRNKEYRHTFVAAHLSTNIAAQIQTLREIQKPEPWTQKELAEKCEMSPARISVMESPSYDKLTLTTLKRIAKGFDVALVVRFVAFSELVNWVSDLSAEKMAVPSFSSDSIANVAVQSAQKRTEDIPSALQHASQQFRGAFLGTMMGQRDEQAQSPRQAASALRAA